MRNRKALAVVILGMFVSSHMAYAAGWGHGQGDAKQRGWRKQKSDFVQNLNLTLEQQEKLRQHRQEQKEVRKGIHQALSEKKTILKDLLKDARFDEAQVRQVSSEISVLRNQLSNLRIDGLIYTRSVLTPEQYAAFVNNMKETKVKPKRRSFFRKRTRPDRDLSENP